MNNDTKNPDEPTKKDVRFVDNKLKVVELDKKGDIIRVIRDYTGPSPNKKKRHAWEKFGSEPITNPIKENTENTEGTPIRFTIDNKERSIDLASISTISPVRHEVRFIDGKLRVVEVDNKGKVVKVVRDYPTKLLSPIEDEKPIIEGEKSSVEQTTELIVKSTIETLSENVTRGAPRFIEKPKPIIKKRVQRVIIEPTIERTIESIVEEKAEDKIEDKVEQKIEQFPELDIRELLDNDKLYDENTHLLYCPDCHRYEVRFMGGRDAWICNWCSKQTYYDDFKFSDKNKYQIYKLWGIEALRDVTHMKLDVAKQFVASYFKKCCETKKDKCLYFGIFEEEQITDKFEMAKMVCNFIRRNIEENSAVIETLKSLLDEDVQKQIDEEHAFLIQVADLMTIQLDDYLIATAGIDLEKDQVAYVIVDNDNLTVDLNPIEGMECIECFAWNKTDKGGVVGVSSLPSNSLNELRQMFKLFTDKINQYINTGTLKNVSKVENRIKSLSSEEKKVLSFIRSSDNGCVQSQLWKKLDIDKDKCSRILESLSDLIIKEPTNYCGAYTHRLKIIELGILSLELEIDSGQTTTKKNTIKKKTYKRKRKEKQETKEKEKEM